MLSIHTFDQLDAKQRELLFSLITRDGGNRHFGTLAEMIEDYSGATFAGGRGHFSAWDGEVPVAALAVIATTVAENGEAMLVSPTATAADAVAFVELLQAATDYAKSAGAQREMLQLRESTVWLRSLAETAGFTFSHEGLTLCYRGERRPPSCSDLSLRHVTPDDAATYARIDHDAFVTTPNGRPTTAEEVLTSLADPEVRFLIAHLGDQPVATAELTLREHDGWIGSIAVDPAWQRRGLGRDLLRLAINLLLECGYGEVRLGVMTANQRALGLYLSEGFAKEKVSSVWLRKNL